MSSIGVEYQELQNFSHGFSGLEQQVSYNHCLTPTDKSYAYSECFDSSAQR